MIIRLRVLPITLLRVCLILVILAVLLFSLLQDRVQLVGEREARQPEEPLGARAFVSQVRLLAPAVLVKEDLLLPSRPGAELLPTLHVIRPARIEEHHGLRRGADLPAPDQRAKLSQHAEVHKAAAVARRVLPPGEDVRVRSGVL